MTTVGKKCVCSEGKISIKITSHTEIRGLGRKDVGRFRLTRVVEIEHIF